MASLSQLQTEVMGWLDRQDLTNLFPGWVLMVESDIAMTLRARCMVSRGLQSIDGNFIELPSDFLAMESIRNDATGEVIDLEDAWTGPAGTGPVQAYRLVANCIEFLPHPALPTTTPEQAQMNWYAAPTPLSTPASTNKVLEQLYGVYLWGVCKYGAMAELDGDRATQAGQEYDKIIGLANLWNQSQQYSGAPLRAALPAAF